MIKFLYFHKNEYRLIYRFSLFSSPVPLPFSKKEISWQLRYVRINRGKYPREQRVYIKVTIRWKRVIMQKRDRRGTSFLVSIGSARASN